MANLPEFPLRLCSTVPENVLASVKFQTLVSPSKSEGSIHCDGGVALLVVDVRFQNSVPYSVVMSTSKIYNPLSHTAPWGGIQ